MVESRSTLHAPAETSVSGRSIAETDFYERREALLARLIFSARSLAEAQLRSRGDDKPLMCVDCGLVQDVFPRDQTRRHHPTCKTGRVLGILDDLANLNLSTEERSSARDESFPAAAPVEERPRVLTYQGISDAIDELFQK
ncbi:MAG TPA: hypothetical protein VMF66_04235, partial [Candidatus Acidoferrum sp.]|nr:hypothetical protein [Candidatus Acidoferrum sp.]